MTAMTLQDLQRAPSPHAVEAFLAQHTFPLVDGRTVTFVYRGSAHGVFLQHWIQGLPQQQPFRRLHGTDLWWLTVDIPEQSRIEYKFVLQIGPHKRLVEDPLNPHKARDPFGANSVVHGHGYETPGWTQHDPDARPGELRDYEIDSTAFGRRPLQVYVPARFRPTRRYPLLIAHDGPDYLRFSNLQTVLDNLIHRLEIQPLIVALTGSPNRLHEYGAEPAHARFVADDVLPWLEGEFPLLPGPAHRGLLGASFGAVAALSTAWRRQGTFGKLLLQSGSFLFTDIGDHEGGPHFDSVVAFMNELRDAPGRPADQLFLTCGTYEPMIYYNRSMVPVFESTGMAVRFSEARDGHNWENWRDRLREGLSYLFPGPLWMVYE